MTQLPGKEYIFQNDQKNYEAFHTAESKGVNVSSLFDLSHGAGVLPEKWPKSPSNIKTGFAGGLGPENIVEQVDKINEAAESPRIYSFVKEDGMMLRSSSSPMKSSKSNLIKMIENIPSGHLLI